jgi:acetoin utilization deacetylase AcuC-like enzyme
VTERLTETANRHCDGRLVSVLEGGYDLKALGSSAAAHVTALMRAH